MKIRKAQAEKFRSIIQLLIIIAIIVLANIAASYVYTRIDLTTDKRYSLAPVTKDLMRNLDDVVYVKVYLENDNLPGGFRRLQAATKDMLDEMQAYAGNKLQFEFINPSSLEDPKEQRAYYEQLVKKGLKPVNLSVQGDEGSSQRIIFPGATFSYRNKQLSLKLLQEQLGRPPEEVLHSSIVSLEYEIANTIRKLKIQKKPKIAFIQGHGEFDTTRTQGIRTALSSYYEVEYINLPSYKVGILENFDMAVVAKPTRSFSEIDKYKLDQFIMKGGKVLWLVESLVADMDSLRNQQGLAVTADYPLNLEDQLFKYGVRVNRNLVQDLQCHMIGLVRQGQRDFAPWPYYPLIVPSNDHPIVNNLNAIWFRFANSIDTVGADEIKKTVLLKSSNTSRVVYHPARISLGFIQDGLNPRLYQNPNQPLAVLLEGSFTSLYENRLKPKTIESGKFGKPIEKGDSTAMIVVSDGDIIKNDYNAARDLYMPLGYDPKTNQTFGNETFLLNCIDYLMSGSELIKLRSKDFKLRLLNSAKVKNEKNRWQLINMIAPVAALLLFGFIYNLIRRRKYSKI